MGVIVVVLRHLAGQILRHLAGQILCHLSGQLVGRLCGGVVLVGVLVVAIDFTGFSTRAT
ncbi:MULTISPECIES: hypothetical protein [Mycobacteriaceae]|uniref:Uncharacterized protein n=1 Tax=Mycolicibacterium parafortuitum TaxID=39692 RepID=A0ACC6MEB7_MYCPF|nr:MULTISPECIES: hypothetical protein [Mycobacteriaceae]MDZ5085320.1 hypothetical protein [Mycolicibacterium parafortuitum]